MAAEMNVEFILNAADILIRAGINPLPFGEGQRQVSLTLPLSYGEPGDDNSICTHYVLYSFGTDETLRELADKMSDKFPMAPLACIPIGPQVAQTFARVLETDLGD